MCRMFYLQPDFQVTSYYQVIIDLPLGHVLAAKGEMWAQVMFFPWSEGASSCWNVK